MWNKQDWTVIWTFFGIVLLWDWNEDWPFSVLWPHCWVFQICWHIECNTLTASSFRILNSLSGIPSPLALFIVTFPTWLHNPGCLALGEWSHHCRHPGQFSSVPQSCPTLCDPMNHNMPGFPVHHQLPEFTQTHVHRVSDAIQPSHPLLSPSPPRSEEPTATCL